jgi:antitoxin ParD1/3/4
MIVWSGAMASIKELNVKLTTEQVSALEAAVESGEYATTSEVVREALRDWQVKRDLGQRDVERLRQIWDDGVASGVAGELDMTELRREARERLEVKKKASGNAG